MTKPGRPLLSLLLALPLMAGAAFAQTPERPPAKAGYMTLEQAEVPVIMNLTGRAVAVNTAQIRPRVSGMIREILYTPGSYVEAGTPLFAIDPLTYEIALRVAEANLERAKADLSTAQSAFERAEKLQGQQATSRATFETVETTLLKARASLSESEARLALAKAELEWTVIRAPASGVAGIATVAVGDLVSASQTALTEIVQTDPILVDLTEPYPTRLRLESAAAEGRITLQDPSLTLVLNDGSRIEGKARLVSTGATVSATTGTRRLRFEMENPSGRVSPGMFVQGEMTLGRTEAILVPQRAAVRQRDGSLSAWIAKDGKATRRPIEENGTWKNQWVVTDGLEAGEWLLVDGIAQIRDGQPVELTPAAIDADGVVRDSNPAQVGN